MNYVIYVVVEIENEMIRREGDARERVVKRDFH